MPRIALILLYIFGFVGAACGGSSADPNRPEATLASSYRAQRTVRELENTWASATPRERLDLQPRLQRALRSYGDDPAASTLRHYLAWIHLERGDLSSSERLLLEDNQKSKGTANDFAGVLRAGISLRRGHAVEALMQLQELHGLLIVPDHRATCDELLIEAALVQKQVPLASHHMVDLLLNSPTLRQQPMQLKISNWLSRLPSSEVEDAYASLSREQPPDSAERRKYTQAVNLLLGLVRRRLLDSALKEQDAQLAQRIIEHYVPGGDSEALAKLAATGNMPARVVGRSVGLILELGNALLSQRSAQVALGLSATLDLFAPKAGASETTLRTRTADEATGLALAYQQLISDGAALIVAGMDDASAATIAALAERARMPTLLVTRDALAAPSRRWAFGLGESAQRITDLLSQWARGRGLSPQLLAADDRRCDFEGAAVGRASFPVSEWQAQHVTSLLILGNQTCAATLFDELGRAKYAPVLLLGLDTAHLLGTAPRTATLKAGSFPEQAGASSTGTRHSWYYSIGHDAALWAAAATRDFDSVMTNQPEEVALLHSKVASALRQEQVENLWTTEKRAFNDAAILERQLAVTTVGIP
jgi:hypothetical protein